MDVLNEAMDKIKDIQKTKFVEIAKELQGEDPYQFIRAYSPGKFIECTSMSSSVVESLIKVNKSESLILCLIVLTTAKLLVLFLYGQMLHL